ncbi:MAG TPA: hypothetical protein ENK22_02730, partial [Persephonella sp.]|nr:hypothetical protein [Persephonella sp.]
MKKTVYRVLFPSQIKNCSRLEINGKIETAVLEKKFGYYSFKHFSSNKKNIRMFALAENCLQVYAVDEDNDVYLIDVFN